MSYYFDVSGIRPKDDGEDGDPLIRLVQISTFAPSLPETPPSPWLVCKDALKVIDLDSDPGREELAGILQAAPVLRITLELLIDKILTEALQDETRAKGVRSAFSPEVPPEPVADGMAQKYAFSGTLRFPIIASRSTLQLLKLYLRLYGPATPQHPDVYSHIAALYGPQHAKILERCDGVLWQGQGFVRLDRLIYGAERMDCDPEVTFESYVTRGRAAAEALAIDEPEPLLAAWIQAERVQMELCRDIDSILRLSGIRMLPKWVRTDVFRILEREAMKQVFAENLFRLFAEWPALRRCKILSEPITANAKGEVSPLLQQLLNQTLSADARYAGSAEAFTLQAERRFQEARQLLGQSSRMHLS